MTLKSPPSTATRIWDLPTRLFHWALALCVIGSIASAKLSDEWMDWHFRFGYAVLALLVFRLIWGFVGGHWSRFGSFLYGPRAIRQYLRGQASAHMQAGHSPLGALSVFALLMILILQVLSGLSSDDAITFTGPLAAHVPGAWVEWATGYHKALGQLLVFAIIALHVLAVLFYLLVKRRNLIAPMLHGDKHALPDHLPAARDSWRMRLLALALLGASAALAWWVASLA